MSLPKRPSFTQEEALAFHALPKPGKIEITPTKPMATQRDLSLAYSPGVAVPVRMIAERPDAVYDYTAKGNFVAVISNGTAILGLGDLGALASKPVMEGKAVLFKRFADVDSIDLEVGEQRPVPPMRRADREQPRQRALADAAFLADEAHRDRRFGALAHVVSFSGGPSSVEPKDSTSRRRLHRRSGKPRPTSKLFMQVFANFCLFSPNFRKHFFGGFGPFQRVTRRKKLFRPMGRFANF